MSWTARKGVVIFVILLFGVQVLETSNEWGGSFSATTVCGLRGSTVEFRCSFSYPATENGRKTTVNNTLWFTQGPNNKPKDLRLDPQYFGRLEFSCMVKNGRFWCHLSIGELRESDEGEYKFRFETTEGGYTLTPGVTLTVNDLNVQVGRPLKCESKCSLDFSPSYIWYKSGQEIQYAHAQTYSYDNYEHSYSCAIRGHQQLVSPPVCVYYHCNKVLYKKRSACALKGSTVDISCSYSTYYSSKVTSKFWFTNLSMPQDLKWDENYKARVELPQELDGRSTLRINNVTERDSAEYRFKFTNKEFEWKSALPGTTLTVAAVQVKVIHRQVEDSHTVAQLACYTSCSPASPLSMCLMLNGRQGVNCAPPQVAKSWEIILFTGDYVTCAVDGSSLNISPRLYALWTPTVSPSDPGEILEGHPLILTCRIDPPTSCRHRWYKNITNSGPKEMSDGAELVFKATKSSDSAEYFCTAENELGVQRSQPVKVDVKYAPRNAYLSVRSSQVIDSYIWVRSSKVIEEGQAVTLTCSSFANPAAGYTLYKDNQTVGQETRGIFQFNSIRPEDAGSFYCKAQNEYGHANSPTEVINVYYGPRLPKVSARPSDSVSVGSRVSLTCSSDANPSASYTWRKDQEKSSISTEAVFNISDFQAHHAGEYHCIARNRMGSLNATLRLYGKTSSLTATVGYVTAGLLLVLLLVVALLLRKKMASKAQPNASADVSRVPPDELVYSTVAFSKQAPIYSNVAKAERHQGEDRDEGVEYTAVNCDGHTSRLKPQEDADVCALYSTVQKNRI